jgi:hypothetical protein
MGASNRVLDVGPLGPSLRSAGLCQRGEPLSTNSLPGRIAVRVMTHANRRTEPPPMGSHDTAGGQVRQVSGHNLDPCLVLSKMARIANEHVRGYVPSFTVVRVSPQGHYCPDNDHYWGQR